MIYLRVFFIAMLILSVFHSVHPMDRSIKGAFQKAREIVSRDTDKHKFSLEKVIDQSLSPILRASRRFQVSDATPETTAFFQIWPIINSIKSDILKSKTVTVTSYIESSFKKSGMNKEQIDTVVAGILKKSGCIKDSAALMSALPAKQQSKLISEIYTQAERIFDFLSTPEKSDV